MAMCERARMADRMMHMGFSYTTPGYTPSQPVTIRDMNRLTVPPSSNADPANARRRKVSSAVQDYLKSLNSMTRSIVLEAETLEEEHKSEWSTMNDTTKEEVMDSHFIPTGVRAQYYYDGRFITDGRTCGPLHLSQPSEWEEREAYNDLVNRSATWVG